ncbi:bifunctional folylpolyglutamate synthase/dihydrofolate synthase [Prevotella sp.]|uniref:bifunctional folylpolyglutamate synthase/dihydrofolate synthase n=1 Tax=Prevotella sp. TaxID=59823 RepID=UPI0025FB2AF2|nr:folylpolyglutamate synthase/dihydrofolate synthase family protein [Prevotella sp.]
MDYKQTVEYLFNSTPVFEKVGASAYKEGLSNTLALDRHFGHPHTHFKSIHIAGTNGKGSCSHTLAAILQSAGYKVGLYTSPHLVDFRERIRVNGVCIDEQYVIDFVENERHFFEPLHPSFFELTTALAFKYFAEQKVDIAIIEVGLGGRLDCTNIITPLVSVITNISLDHTMFLGDTLAKIAKEKAGIIKHEVPVIVGEANDETRPVFERVAREHNAPIVFAEDSSDVVSAKVDRLSGIDYITTGYGNFKGALGGSYQVKNANTILHVVDLLCSRNMSISKACVQKGFAEVCTLTGLMGRWQTVRRQPLVVCDTGHNEGGWQYLGKQILQPECKTRRIVFGMVDDKDIDHVMNHLPKNAVYYFTRATTHRAIPETKVQEYGKQHYLQGNCYGSVAEAYEAALSDADPQDFIFVGGSSYVVADFLEHLQQNK